MVVPTPPAPQILTVVVPQEVAGQRLDRFLADCADGDDESGLAGLSRSRIKRLIKSDQVRLDGRPCRPASPLREGAVVEVLIKDPEPLGLEPEPIQLRILFEDAHLLALVKPPGMVVHPAAGHRTGTLVHALLAHCQDLSGIGGALRPGIVHRLDRGTSGVMVIAKSDRAHEALARQFAERRVKKEYVAFVIGSPTPPHRCIETLYARHPRDRKRFTSRAKQGRAAVTTYQVVASAGGISRLAVLLGTGRTHQIRVHMAEQGHPVVADPLYGGTRWSRISAKTVAALARTLPHHALHAERLSLVHPVTGESMRFKAPLPDALLRLNAALQTAG